MITIIAAVARNGIIGSGNRLPWSIQDDMDMFRRRTFGKPVIMGRKTYESIIDSSGSPLKGRVNIVLSTRTKPEGISDDVHWVPSVGQALWVAASLVPNEEALVIGGSKTYAAFMPIAENMLITWIDAHYPGDTRFPLIDKWRLIKEERKITRTGQIPITFSEYERIY